MYVDSLLVLESQSVGLRDVRYLHPLKVRGVGHVHGRHELRISGIGLEVYPRLEATVELGTARPSIHPERPRVSTGVRGFDDMLRGGLLPSSSSTIWGPPGVGKTVAGISFIVDGAQRGEPSMIVAFQETREMLSLMARGLGLEFDRFVESGLITVQTYLSPEMLLDQWAWEVLSGVRRQQPSRLFIDGIGDIARLATVSDRLTGFFKSLNRELRDIGVTTLFTAEVRELNVGTLSVPSPDLATSSDAVLFLRYVEIAGRLYHLVSVLKLRASGHELDTREFEITSNGIQVFADGDSAAQLLASNSPATMRGQPSVRGRASQGDIG